VQVQPGAAQRLGRRDGLPRGPDQLVGAVAEVAPDVPVMDENTPRSRPVLDVVPGPVPDLGVEAGLGDPLDPFGDRQVEEHHLGADGQSHRHASV
jgi:hypothetical protein